MNTCSTAYRILRRACILTIVYTTGLAASLWLGYQLRFDFYVPPVFQERLEGDLLWIVPLKLILLLCFRQFAGLLSFFSTRDVIRLAVALFCGSAIVGAMNLSEFKQVTPPQGVILIDLVLSVVFLAAMRLTLRLFREHFLSPHAKVRSRTMPVAIIGAGDVGVSLARELSIKRGLGMNPVAFFDDDSDKWQSRVHDIPVLGPPELLLDDKLDLHLEKAVIAMPSATGRRMREVVKILQQAHLRFETVPSLDQVATGKVRVSQLRPVQIQDLLGREPVVVETDNIRRLIQNEVVMVTGAGGSIGSELCRQIAAFNPKKLLLVDQSEVQLFQIEQELITLNYSSLIEPLVADLLDLPRMRAIFANHRPALVFHAAAHKHVPMMERQPSEAVKNNSLATRQLGELARQHGVERFVMISTDKAINPTSVMGATKRLAEILLRELFHQHPEGTKFIAVRFGNVLGSSGSVIPTFNRQIAAGGPVTVTHPEMKRYFMTIPEASSLVLQSATQGTGGEIFVLDMGELVRIDDLARQLIELSGLKPGDDIEIRYVGLRPGEKMVEELRYHSESILPTSHRKIMRFICQNGEMKSVWDVVEKLSMDIDELEPDEIKLALKQAVPEYQPWSEQPNPKASKEQPASPACYLGDSCPCAVVRDCTWWQKSSRAALPA